MPLWHEGRCALRSPPGNGERFPCYSGSHSSPRRACRMVRPANPGPLRAAIVGTGAVARLHAEALALLPDVDLVAAADPMPGRAAEFAATHAVPASFDSLEDLLA